MLNKKIILRGVSGAFILSALCAGQAQAIDLREAIQAALATNPEINQAIANREAVDYEREQALSLYGPRLSVEGSAGVRRLENATRRALDIADETLYPLEASFVAEQVLIDFGARRSELARQAARTDGAASRVEERAEFVALNTSRYYIDYLLQERIVAAAQDNLAFHERLVADLREGVSRGSISIADQQQAQERLEAARARLTEAREEMRAAAISFHQITGVTIGDATMPPEVAPSLPPDLDQAVDRARMYNPRVIEALADLDASSALVRAARAEFGPTLSAEGRIRVGEDIDGFRGNTEDYLGRLVMRWNLFDSGLRSAKVNEAIRRESEQKFRVDQFAREAEANVRTAWNRLESQTSLVGQLEQQSRIADDLLVSYREQFNVGRRSLLDVLDAQNTRYNIQVQVETARLAQLYAQYRVLAAANLLLEALGLQPPAAAQSNARERYNIRTNVPAEVMEARSTYGPVIE